MINDTTIPNAEQPSLESLLADLTADDIGVRFYATNALQRMAPDLARQVVALRAQVAAHEDADRRWNADIRAVEAERDELRRDYRDLIALDTDGLRSRIVAMEDAAEQHRLTLESVTAEAEKYRRWACDMVVEITARNDAADVVAAAEERKRLEAMLDESYRENEAEREALARAMGAPVAVLVAEYRDTIRQLTTRLNEVLAAAEKAGAK